MPSATVVAAAALLVAVAAAAPHRLPLTRSTVHLPLADVLRAVNASALGDRLLGADADGDAFGLRQARRHFAARGIDFAALAGGGGSAAAAAAAGGLRSLQDAAALYGNFVELAYFYADIFIGTPQRKFTVITDTGSSLTAVPCAGCANCGSHMNPRFDPTQSTTAQPAPCSNQCSRCESNGLCGYMQSYAEGSSISGVVYSDVAYLGDDASVSGGPQSAFAIQQFPFGCQMQEGGLFQTQLADGIMGIGQGGDRSFVRALWSTGKLDRNMFSLCMSLQGGAMTLGAIDTTLHDSPVPYGGLPIGWASLSTSGFYVVQVAKFQAAGSAIDAGGFNSGGQSILDSGTTFTYLPPAVFSATEEALRRYCSENSGGTPTSTRCRGRPVDVPNERLCFILADPALDIATFPPIRFTLAGAAAPTNPEGRAVDVDVHMPPEHVWLPMAWQRGAHCLGLYNHNRPGAVLGANFLMGYDVIFDLGSLRPSLSPVPADNPTGNIVKVGFAPSTCRLAGSVSPGATPTPDGGGTTPAATATPSPAATGSGSGTATATASVSASASPPPATGSATVAPAGTPTASASASAPASVVPAAAGTPPATTAATGMPTPTGTASASASASASPAAATATVTTTPTGTHTTDSSNNNHVQSAAATPRADATITSEALAAALNQAAVAGGLTGAGIIGAVALATGVLLCYCCAGGLEVKCGRARCILAPKTAAAAASGAAAAAPGVSAASSGGGARRPPGSTTNGGYSTVDTAITIDDEGEEEEGDEDDEGHAAVASSGAAGAGRAGSAGGGVRRAGTSGVVGGRAHTVVAPAAAGKPPPATAASGRLASPPSRAITSASGSSTPSAAGAARGGASPPGTGNRAGGVELAPASSSSARKPPPRQQASGAPAAAAAAAAPAAGVASPRAVAPAADPVASDHRSPGGGTADSIVAAVFSTGSGGGDSRQLLASGGGGYDTGSVGHDHDDEFDGDLSSGAGRQHADAAGAFAAGGGDDDDDDDGLAAAYHDARRQTRPASQAQQAAAAAGAVRSVPPPGRLMRGASGGGGASK